MPYRKTESEIGKQTSFQKDQFPIELSNASDDQSSSKPERVRGTEKKYALSSLVPDRFNKIKAFTKKLDDFSPTRYTEAGPGGPKAGIKVEAPVLGVGKLGLDFSNRGVAPIIKAEAKGINGSKVEKVGIELKPSFSGNAEARLRAQKALNADALRQDEENNRRRLGF